MNQLMTKNQARRCIAEQLASVREVYEHTHYDDTPDFQRLIDQLANCVVGLAAIVEDLIEVAYEEDGE